VDVRRLGRVPYDDAWALQNKVADERRTGLVPDTLILLEHPHTYTIGRSGTRDHVFLNQAQMAARGITCLDVDRGGDVTYHGPGQLVGYPILDLGPKPDVGLYLRNLEGCLIDVLADFGIASGRLSGYTGVWIEDRKIAAIGIKVAQGVTTHGFALNAHPGLRDPGQGRDVHGPRAWCRPLHGGRGRRGYRTILRALRAAGDASRTRCIISRRGRLAQW
jgi:lipoyl(octanoyl) transferase